MNFNVFHLERSSSINSLGIVSVFYRVAFFYCHRRMYQYNEDDFQFHVFNSTKFLNSMDKHEN